MVSEQESGEGVESSGRGSLWAVVLARREGTRLRPLVRHLCGDERPKQFSPLLGARTLLGQTLDRVGRLIPPERTVFLSGSNPNLPYDTLNGLLLAHGGHHVQQIQQVQNKQYAEEVQTWEAMKRYMYVIADALAGAIAKPFPKQFS